MSNGMYCTQCEAQGFRKITFYPDRPDVMATFSVRIEGDAPVLLSNGNLVASGPGWAEWERPASASPPISSRWWRATCAPSRTASSPAPAARCCCRSGCATATSRAAPMRWTR